MTMVGRRGLLQAVRVAFILVLLIPTACSRNIVKPSAEQPLAAPSPPITRPTMPESKPGTVPSDSRLATPDQLAAFEAAGKKTPSDYLLYKGDSVDVKITGYPEFSREYKVLEDGTLALPVGPPVPADGNTLEELRKNIARTLQRYLTNPQVSVALIQAGQRMVTILGEVPKPGRMPIIGQGTLVETLLATGWNYDPSRPHSITLVREKRSIVFELAPLFETNNLKYNIKLVPDDILMVTLPTPVTVEGAVTKPDRFSVGHKGWISIREALTKAGGLTSNANLEKALIVRRSGESLSLDLNTELFTTTAGREVQLLPGDTLSIPHTPETGVYILGMVNHPGFHRQPGRIRATQALALADHAQFGAVLTHAKVVRNYGQASQEVIALNFDKIFQRGDLSQDIELQNGDVLYVPESTTSDVLDFMGRVLGPVSGSALLFTNIKTATE